MSKTQPESQQLKPRTTAVSPKQHAAQPVNAFHQDGRSPLVLNINTSRVLQRTIGNWAVGRLFSKAAGQTTDKKAASQWETAVSPLNFVAPIQDTFFRNKDLAVQRAHKTEKERGEKHQRVEMAKKAIPLLKSKVDSKLKDHLFDAKPINGGAIKKDEPTGLHAYKGGGLPKDVKVVETQGSTGKVHGIKWRWQGSKSEKKSTMFPDWMPADHVSTLIALEEQDVKDELPSLGISSDMVKTYILHGQEITIKSSGDTTYPSRPDLDTWIKA